LCSSDTFTLYDAFSGEPFVANAGWAPVATPLATHTTLKSRDPGGSIFPSDAPLPQTVRVEVPGTYGQRVRHVTTRFFNTLPAFSQRLLQDRGLYIQMMSVESFQKLFKPGTNAVSSLTSALVIVQHLSNMRNMVHVLIHELGHALSYHTVGGKILNIAKFLAHPQSDQRTPTAEYLESLLQDFRNEYSSHRKLSSRSDRELLLHPLFFDFVTQDANPASYRLVLARQLLRLRMDKLYQDLVAVPNPFMKTYASVSEDELWAELTAAYIGVSINTDMTGRIIDAAWIHDFYPPYYELLQTVYGKRERWRKFLAR
jgi:hypothetical protein